MFFKEGKGLVVILKESIFGQRIFNEMQSPKACWKYTSDYTGSQKVSINCIYIIINQINNHKIFSWFSANINQMNFLCFNLFKDFLLQLS